MKLLFKIFLACMFLILVLPFAASAQEDKIQELERKINELSQELQTIKAQGVDKKIDIVTEEIEKLKIGAVAEPKYGSYSGLGPAASKIYGINKGFSIGGYGEVSYSNYRNSTKKDIADVYRFILYGGYKFNDRILMNTEIEYEHAGIGNLQSKESEVYVEFSYLDFLLKKSFNLRAGLMLMPIGFINELHEPTVYHGVLRPEVETNLIPSTWRELGVMAYGEPIEKLTYKIALTNGLRADKFSNSTWIRGSRQQGAKVNADVGAIVANVNYEIMPGLSAGGSYYMGEGSTGKGGDKDASTDKEAEISLYELHADFKYKGLELRGLYAAGKVNNVNNAFKNDATLKKVGKEVDGWYLQAAYDIFPLIKPGIEMSLTPFIRYEQYDTNKEVISGNPDPALDRIVTTFGFDFKPHPNVVIKADYQWKDTESDKPEGTASNQDSNKIDQFNMGIGFIF